MPTPSETAAARPAEPNLGAVAAARTEPLARGYVANLDIGPDDAYALFNLQDNLMPFLFRPTPVRDAVRVNYGQQAVLGMSHAYDSYQHTSNTEWSFELYANALMLAKDNLARAEVDRRAGEGVAAALYAEVLEDYRRFLQALTVPAERPDGANAAPPACLLCLPGICSARCRLIELAGSYEDVDAVGNLMEFRFAVTFREAPLKRITMQDVLLNGAFRAQGGV